MLIILISFFICLFNLSIGRPHLYENGFHVVNIDLVGPSSKAFEINSFV